MKKTLILMLAVFALAACKKNNGGQAPGGSLNSKLIGRWELRETMGGFKDSTYAAGNGTIIQFKSNNTYSHFTKGVQDDQGTYQYKKNGITFSGTQYDELILNYTYGQPATLNGNKLSIGTSVADGPQSDFVRISD
jgi:hypothetical protein